MINIHAPEITFITSSTYRALYRDIKKKKNIHAQEAIKVKVTEESIKSGYKSVEKHARRFLKVGETYTIDCIIIHGWTTYVYLKDIPNQVFNSVSFEQIGAKENIEQNNFLPF